MDISNDARLLKRCRASLKRTTITFSFESNTPYNNFDDLKASNMTTLGGKLLNSANVWASTKEELVALYDCPHTGAVTVRTSLLNGFAHDDSIHQYCFFDAATMAVYSDDIHKTESQSGPKIEKMSSLNTLGYSPVALKDYIDIVKNIGQKPRGKPVIFSVTGTVTEVVECHHLLALEAEQDGLEWMMEVNLSCPNIDGKPPPAYSKPQLLEYLVGLQTVTSEAPTVKIGIKTPPYTYQGQFDDLIAALLEATFGGVSCPISFITATNTLGSSLVLNPANNASVICSSNGLGIGGLAGAALHPLALGNVRIIRRMLDKHKELENILIIGVGGVSDGAGYRRMINAGASAVAIGTALGSYGIGIFRKIVKEAAALSGDDGGEKR